MLRSSLPEADYGRIITTLRWGNSRNIILDSPPGTAVIVARSIEREVDDGLLLGRRAGRLRVVPFGGVAFLCLKESLSLLDVSHAP
jgi:Mrp family chromosome partitioning ATPase